MPADIPDGPAVTILVASYNYARFLRETLDSALAQSFGDFELLVVEDGSTDGSLALARQYAARDARVRVLTHADGGNHGLPATLALGLAHARGRCVAFLESDDRWHPDSLRQRMRARVESGAGVVFSDVEPLLMPGMSRAWFDGYAARVMREHARRACGYGGRPPRVPRAMPFALRTEFLAENAIPTFSCALVDTALLRSCSLHSPVPRWLDWWVWAQLAQTTRFAFVPEKLTQWRLHGTSQHHRIAPLKYLLDYDAMWRGLRRELSPHCPPDSPPGRILRMPSWTRLAVRFWRMARAGGGVRRAMTCVMARLF